MLNCREENKREGGDERVRTILCDAVDVSHCPRESVEYLSCSREKESKI